ncbi:MAG: polyprenyl synthetase family protein [Bacteroidota bacterium]|nr:polyprenyl synthetase family protein [Bacteroidota bacterium]
MAKLADIKAPIAQEMKEFDKRFKSNLRSNTPVVDRVMNYMVRRKGKQLRPILVFLTAKMLGDIRDRTYIGASLIELMHTATLVHDDVVDDADMRRGFFSINALWKNKVAVLIGDYLLSKVLLLAVDRKEYELLETVSTAVKSMSEGELLQIEKARKLDITEDIYYQVIKQKTAVLMETCCVVGAQSANASQEVQGKMQRFGRELGLAFQIKDDLFDFERVNLTGKPSGIDIKEQKMTLPLINALQNATPAKRKTIIRIIKKYHNRPKKVAEVVDFVRNSGGLDYAREKMENHLKNASEILSNFPPSKERDALNEVIAYTGARKK